MWADTTYEDLLARWVELRSHVSVLPTEEALHEIHNWWNRAPISPNQYLHMEDVESWPDPWHLLLENSFCDIAKCLGMCYTILLSEIDCINSVRLVQTDNYNILVKINDGQFVLNESLGEIAPATADTSEMFSVDTERLQQQIK